MIFIGIVAIVVLLSVSIGGTIYSIYKPSSNTYNGYVKIKNE